MPWYGREEVDWFGVYAEGGVVDGGLGASWC